MQKMNQVTFRTGLGFQFWGFVIALIFPLTLVLFGSGLFNSSSFKISNFIPVLIFFSVLIALLSWATFVLFKSFEYDRLSRVIRFRDNTEISVGEIYRITADYGTRSRYWLSFWLKSGKKIRISIESSLRKKMTAEQWQVLPEILNGSTAPGIEFDLNLNGTSNRWLDRHQSTKLLNQQLAWITAGNPPSSSSAPFQRFVLSNQFQL